MRIIPRLDIKNENVIKGINFEGLRVVGNPNEIAKKYYQEGADELIYSDCVASLYGYFVTCSLLHEQKVRTIQQFSIFNYRMCRIWPCWNVMNQG